MAELSGQPRLPASTVLNAPNYFPNVYIGSIITIICNYPLIKFVVLFIRYSCLFFQVNLISNVYLKCVENKIFTQISKWRRTLLDSVCFANVTYLVALIIMKAGWAQYYVACGCTMWFILGGRCVCENIASTVILDRHKKNLKEVGLS